MSDLVLIVDLERGRPGSKFRHFTGIFVRAKYVTSVGDEWGSFDIATLTHASLHEWMRARKCADQIVDHLLEHPPEEPQ